jgi:long-chain acyl-CoA synthetase
VLVLESGHNIAPAAIEQKLIDGSFGIEQAMVVGHGRPYLTAIVAGPADPTALDLARETVNAALPHYMRLRKLYRAPEHFSEQNGLLTANQKLRRKAVEERYQKVIRELYQ